jgi:predicted acetyltransferase
MSNFDYHVAANATDIQELGRILSQCFIAPVSDEPRYLDRLGIENVRILRNPDQIVGGLGILRLGQWFGSQRVEMAGIAAVGIAPEYRGKGAAIALMQQTLQELHDQDVPLSVLYPATQTLYRKVGYEQAGMLCKWEVATADIQIRNHSLPIEAIAIDVNKLNNLYCKQATVLNGHLDRNSVIWTTLLDSSKEMPLCVYRLGSETHPQGYVVFQQKRNGNRCEIQIRDWVLLTSEAIERFWTFLGDHRSQIDVIQWRSAPIDALTLSLPEQVAKVRELDRWLLRIIHVKHALEQRGYPPGIEAELHFDIHDPLFPRNTGKFILTVANGVGTVIAGGRGDLQLDINTLSPLYSGLFSPIQLKGYDRLSGTDQALAIATQLFTGSPPWMPDFF